MKIIKLSLATCLAIASLSSIGSAQSLEEAIKGVDVSGMLRYRYTDFRTKNFNFVKSNFSSDNPTKEQKESGTRGGAVHQWRAEALFKTPVINNVSFNLGIGYHNAQQNVNHGKGIIDDDGNTTNSFLGQGLGAGSDGQFGVRQFNLVITPDSSTTTVRIGKMLLDTPLNDTLDDRGTGIFVTNSDLQHANIGVTFVAGAFDSWSLDDRYPGYALTSDTKSIVKPLYTVAALGNYDTGFGLITSQLWLYHIQDIASIVGFGELAWDNDIFSLKGQYAYSRLDNSGDSVIRVLNDNNKTIKNNDLITLNAGARFHNFNVPAAIKVGYWGNTRKNLLVSLDNEGSFEMVGNLWYDWLYEGGQSISMFSHGQKHAQNKLNAFYGNINYDILENLNAGISYVYGRNKATRPEGKGKLTFQEISPEIKWKYSKSITFSSYYSFLKRKIDNNAFESLGFDDATNTRTDRINEFRVEAKYSF